MGPESRPLRRDDVLPQTAGETVVLLTPDTGAYYTLNDVGGVSLEGSLPPKRISARRSNGRVRGRIADRFGHPVWEVKLQLQRRTGGRWRKVATGVTSSRGAFSLGGARQGGSYRVVAKLGGTTARGAVR